MSTVENQAELPDFARCDAFWARREMDRPLLSCCLNVYPIAKHYPCGVGRIPDGVVHPADIEVAVFARDFENLYAAQRLCGADVPWVAYPLHSLPWCEAILGCPILNSGGNMVAQPWMADYRQLEEHALSPENPWLRKLIEFQEFLAKLSNRRFPISSCLMRGPLDLLAALRGPERMCLDLYDSPAEVAEALRNLALRWIEIARAQARVIPAFAGGYSLGIFDLWGRKPGGWFQNDAAALWSPEAWRRLVKPGEEQLAGCMQVTGRHLHPDALFTVTDLVALPQLSVIEINYEKPFGPSLLEMLPSLREVMAAKCLVIRGAFDPADLEVIAQNLPSRGLCLDMIGDTPDQLHSLGQAVRRIWH